MNLSRCAGVILCGVALSGSAAIETAGTLLLDVNASSLSALSDNAKVTAWANAGSLGGQFVPAVSGQGPAYRTSVGGTPAVSFAASANSVMTNSVTPPTSILSNNIWSAEIWVLNPTLENPEDQLSWTDRGSWTGSADGTCMEIRYCFDTANAVEHYNSTCNIPWSGTPPQAGVWHHVAITRDASGVERLYADGVLRTTKTPAVANLRGGGRFALGGVWDRGAASWTMLFSGSLAAARIHSGTLSSAQVLSNYLQERDTYQAIWIGAAGTPLAWSDPANWEGGNVAGSGETAWLTNSGVAVLSSSVALNHLYATAGGLTINSGASLTLGGFDSVYMGDVAPFTFTLSEGAFKVPGNSAINLYMGNNGSDVAATIGGSGAAALLEVDRDTILANSSGSDGTLTVGAGAAIFNSNGWFYVANSVGASEQVTINGGTIGFRLADKAFAVNANGARSQVVVNNGLIDATGDFKWSAGTSTNRAYGAVYLNGGTLQAKRFEADTTAGTNLLYLNGGTIKARVSAADFLFNLTAAYVQSGGAFFDIPTNVVVTAAQGLTEDPSSTGGGLTKSGPGRITFSSANTFSGNITVSGGDLFFTHASGLRTGYAGAVSVANGGSVGYNAVGGAALLNTKLTPSSSGYLTLFANNAAESVDFSAYPDMRLFLSGVGNYTGTFTPYQGRYSYRVEGNVVTNGTTLADAGATPAHLVLLGTSGSGLALTNANTFTGGAVIDTATLALRHAGALGTQATPGVRDVDLRNGGVIRFEADMDVAAFVANRLTTTSTGYLLLGAANAGKSVDLSSHPGVVLGSADLSLDYIGSITPAALGYRLGGGNAAYQFQGYRGLSVSNLTDRGGPTPVVIGTPGNVELKSGNTYSGGTVLTNRGVLFLREDGLGAASSGLTVDNGVIRSGNANFSLGAGHAVSVGAGGMELHPWGGYTMTVNGNLSGSGRIYTTDGGYVTFGGAANTYNGRVDIAGGHNIRIGSGANFSWTSTGGVVDNGTLYLKTDNTSTFSDTVSGTGAVRKEGTGTLTLSTPASYSGVTYVDAGTLRVAATNVLPRGAGKGVVELKTGAKLDANGGDLLVGGLSGYGAVTNASETAKTLYAGENSVTSTFSGAISPSLSLIKVGGGKQTLGGSNVRPAQATVQGGVLELSGPVAVTGTAAVASGATLLVSDAVSGLVGEFFDLASAPVPGDFGSLATITALLAGRTPALTTSSLYLGTAFDLGATGAGYTPNFPTAYNVVSKENFVTRWTGYFLAEQAGSYTFATASDDGSMLFVDGATVVNNNAMQSYAPASKVSGSVTLAAGMHNLVIVMYEAAGDQGLTVWVTTPGGTQQTLPTRLLFSGNTGAAQVGALAGAAGSTLNFVGTNSSASLTLTGNGNMTFDGAITGSNSASRLVKTGSGLLSLSARTSDFYGMLDVQGGAVALTNGAGTLGTLALSSGTTAYVSGLNGLEMRFYNRSAADGDYAEFQSLAAWETYLSTTFPSGPSYVTNSLMLGANLDTGAAGEYWPNLYKQTGGAEADTYDTYIVGSIFLSQSGLYTFATASDDGSMLYIDRSLVVANGYDQGVTTRSGTVNLTSGFHDIAILYRENTGGNALRVSIGYPGQSTVLMPQSILFGGAQARGLSGAAGSALNLGTASSVLLTQSADTQFAGDIVGGAASRIQKSGSGTLTLTGANEAFAGGHIINAGTLRVGNGGEAGALGPSASVAIAAAGTLAFSRAGTVTVGGPLSGTGLLRIDGPGEVRLASTNDFTGRVLINGGRLTVATNASLGAGAAVTNAATVAFETSGTRLQSAASGALAGSGGLEVTGTGTLVLDRTNTYSGATRVTTGATLQLARPEPLSGGGSIALDGGTLALQPEVKSGTNSLAPALAAGAWQLNGNAVWTNRSGTTWAQLTANGGSLAGSAFATNRLEAGVPWYAAFRYEVGDHPVSAADGVAFILQSGAVTALGASGGALGVSGITPSIGMFFNIYQTPTFGWIVDGARADETSAINGINPTNGMDVALAYDGVKLTLTVTQGAKVYTATRTVDLTAKFGASKVVAGFTGATGGATAQQFVGNFSLTDAVPVATTFGNALTVADGLTGNVRSLLVNDSSAFAFNGLTLGAGATLNAEAASGSKANASYVIAPSNVTVAAGTSTVNLAANGTGKGVLALTKLTIGSGAKLVVTGAASVPGGVLTVVVPTPVPRGITQLADFRGATWVGGQPTIVLKDALGNVIDEVTVLRNGLLYINTIQGTLILLR